MQVHERPQAAPVLVLAILTTYTNTIIININSWLHKKHDPLMLIKTEKR